MDGRLSGPNLPSRSAPNTGSGVTQSEHLVRVPVRHAHTISHRPLATLFAEFVTRYAGHLFCN